MSTTLFAISTSVPNAEKYPFEHGSFVKITELTTNGDKTKSTSITKETVHFMNWGEWKASEGVRQTVIHDGKPEIFVCGEEIINMNDLLKDNSRSSSRIVSIDLTPPPASIFEVPKDIAIAEKR